MKKLSKIQIRTIEEAKHKIEVARSFETFEEYEGETNHFAKSRGGVEYVKANIEHYEQYRIFWERYKNGDVLTSAGKPTIEALVKLGIFSKPEYSTYRKQGVIDWVHYNEDWEA